MCSTFRQTVVTPPPSPVKTLRRELRGMQTAAILGGLLYVSLSGASVQAQSVPTQPLPPSLSPASNSRIEADINILKPGDEVQLTVLGFPDLSGNQTILADGTIQLPLVGSVAVEGLTPNQVVARLTEDLAPYVRRPQVSLALLTIRPSQISVTGEVRRPGAHLLVAPEDIDDDTETTGEEFQTLSYALVTAGGVTPDADLRNIVIRRRRSPEDATLFSGPDPWTEIRVDLWSLIQQGDLASDVRIYHGDEIIVPTAQLAIAEQEQLLNSTLAPTTIAVQVAGEVLRPGQLQIAADADVNAAVIAAGGFTENAREGEIALLRMSPEGQLEQQVYAFGETSTPLRDGDVIVVDATTRRDVGNAFEFLGTILNPLSTLFFLLN